VNGTSCDDDDGDDDNDEDISDSVHRSVNGTSSDGDDGDDDDGDEDISKEGFRSQICERSLL